MHRQGGQEGYSGTWAGCTARYSGALGNAGKGGPAPVARARHRSSAADANAHVQ